MHDVVLPFQTVEEEFMNHALKRLPGDAHPIRIPGFWIVAAIIVAVIILLPVVASSRLFLGPVTWLQ